MAYDHKKVDAKWQRNWEQAGIFHAEFPSKKDPYYLLIEFPYPSGAGLHVGHPRSYTALDVIARKRRMEGFNVLYPIGWDAFGLPTENFAIKVGRSPQAVTAENIATFKRQLQSLGFSFDWSREINTTDPEYYKWTQWQFLQFFKAGLAYKKSQEINWCTDCKIGLANEEVVDRACERCGGTVEKREKDQWMIAITKYADKLLEGLDTVDFWEKIKKQQVDWIGKSEGAEIDFEIAGADEKIIVFTTRPDTIFGVTYLVLAPEHPLVKTITTEDQQNEVAEYVATSAAKSDIERADETKEKTGVFTGAYGVHPISGEQVPIWIADYVLASYGTGAIMAVPAHDKRDFAFAKAHDLPIRQVITPHIVLNGKNTPKADLPMQEMRRTVDAMIENEKGEYLLQIEDDQVHFVGGGIEEGETSEEAILREIIEETGYTNVEITRMVIEHIHAQAYRIPKDRNQYCDSTFFAVKLLGEERIKSEVEDGKHEVKWMPKSEVEKKITWDHHAFAWKMYQGEVFTDEGVLVNSAVFDGLPSKEASEKIISALAVKGAGRKKITYRLRDWVFSRQRYWGEPIPLVKCAGDCSPETGHWVAVPDSDLPVELPVVEKYEPMENGESPLAAMTDWVNTTCSTCGGAATRETDTMPNWAGSSWYFLRYIDPQNTEVFADPKKLAYWMPVDWYNGGMEHTTLHLLYSRFWNRFLFDQGLVPVAEPYAKRTSHGLILAVDGSKMSKSKGNVVNPDEIVQEYGADTLRVYELFMGPFAEPVPWSMNGVIGVRRFLEKVARLPERAGGEESEAVTRALHQTIRKVTQDIEALHFNTAISQMMTFVNVVNDAGAITDASLQIFLQILNPFAPHLTNELAHNMGVEGLLETGAWPVWDDTLATESEVNIAVQVNGKLRGTVSLLAGTEEADAVAAAGALESVAKYLDGEPKKIVYVKDKLVNFVV